MAAITLLTPDQLAERSKPKGKGRTGRRRSPERTQVIEVYKAMMQEAQPGFGADVFLTADENKRLVRQNLKAAAAELHLALDFRPMKNPTRLHFRFITPEEHAAKPKRGGRPPKHREVEPSQGASEAAQEAHTQPLSGVPDQPEETPNKRTRRPRATTSDAAA